MNFTIVDPGYDWLAVWITGSIGVLVLAWLVVSLIGYGRGWWGDWVCVLSSLVTVFAIIFGVGAGGFGTVNTVRETALYSATVSGLEGLGFDNVLLDGDTLIASRNGEYFEGVLIERAPLAYEVREIVKVVE